MLHLVPLAVQPNDAFKCIMSKFSIPVQALPQNQLENLPSVPAPGKKIFTLELAKWAAKYPHDSDMKIADQRLGYCWMMNAAELDLSGLKLRELNRRGNSRHFAASGNTASRSLLVKARH